MAGTITPYPVYQVPTTPASDSTGGDSINTTQQAAFIDVWFGGPKGADFIQGVTAFTVRKTIQGAGFRPVASMFRQQRTLGNLVATGSMTHYRQRERPIDQILADVYGFSIGVPGKMSGGAPIRYDMMPLTITVQYTLIGVGLDPTTSQHQETWTYPECYITEVSDGHVTDPNGLSTEDVTFECQGWQYLTTAIALATPGFSNVFPSVR